MPKNKSRLFFSHDSNARNSEKLLRVRMHLKSEGYAAYFMILERLREEKDFMSVRDYNAIAFDLRVDASVVKRVVEDFGLFAFTEDGEYFYSESLRDRMESECCDSPLSELSESRSVSGRAGSNARWGNSNDSSKPSWVLREERMAKARERGTHTKEDWDAMVSFFGECVKCGKKGKLIRGHIVPISSGGCDTIGNIQPLCFGCSRTHTVDNIDYRVLWAKSHNVTIPEEWFPQKKGCSEACISSIANCIANCIAPYSKPNNSMANCMANDENRIANSFADKESSATSMANCIANCMANEKDAKTEKKESLTKKENISSNEEIKKENLIKEKDGIGLLEYSESEMFYISSMFREVYRNMPEEIVNEKRRRMALVLKKVSEKPEIMMPESEQEKYLDWYCEPIKAGSDIVRAENLSAFTVYYSAKRWMAKRRSLDESTTRDNKPTDKPKSSRYDKYKSALERLNKSKNGEQVDSDRPDEQ